MTETSEGWDGTIGEAGMARILAAAAPPRIERGFTLETVEGLRRVVLSDGVSHHAFIRYENDTPSPIDIAPPTAGRWDLIVQRRDWGSNTVSTIVLQGPETGNVSSGTPPVDKPEGFLNTPGVVVDTPLFWTWVRNTDNVVRWRYANQPPEQQWAWKNSPLLHPGGPDGPFANSWSRGEDSGGSLNAISDALGIMIGEDGIYDVIARQRGKGTAPGSAYIALSLDGNRDLLEGREHGAWFHDHSSVNYTSTTSTYFGPLFAGELITAGPPPGAGGTLYYGSPYYGGIRVRRVS